MTIVFIGVALLLLALALQAGKKPPSRKLDEIERLQRYADRVRREDAFPFE